MYLLLPPTFFLSVLPWRPRSAVVGSFAFEREEKGEGAGAKRGGLPLAGVQRTRLASVAALCQVFSSCRHPVDVLSSARTAFER